MQTFHEDAEVDLSPIPFDRRASDRWSLDGVTATAFVLGSDQFGKIMSFALTDESHDGLGAVSDEPVTPGTTVSLGFDRAGMFARRAEVVRCVPCGSGYRLGLRYHGRLAA